MADIDSNEESWIVLAARALADQDGLDWNGVLPARRDAYYAAARAARAALNGRTDLPGWHEPFSLVFTGRPGVDMSIPTAWLLTVSDMDSLKTALLGMGVMERGVLRTYAREILKVLDD